MNQTSRIEYDAADLAEQGDGSCVCGFCVAMAAPPVGGDVLGTDEHWTTGPWLRIDGAVDVTADHRLLTPSGPRAAGALDAGDDGAPRLGVNVRTRSGAFDAGGLRFESEAGRACAAR
jgi:hypothetical protein